jgi:hypothetical protein
LLSRAQPQAPLERDFVRTPYAGSQPVEFYRPEEHIECPAFASARDKLAVHKVGANERGYQRMRLPDHRQRILPRSVKERRIRNQSGSARGKEQKIGHFQRVGAMHTNATLSEHGRVKQDVVIEAAKKDTVH